MRRFLVTVALVVALASGCLPAFADYGGDSFGGVSQTPDGTVVGRVTVTTPGQPGQPAPGQPVPAPAAAGPTYPSQGADAGAVNVTWTGNAGTWDPNAPRPPIGVGDGGTHSLVGGQSWLAFPGDGVTPASPAPTPATSDPASPPPATPALPSVADVVSTGMATLRLPVPGPHVGPAPETNEWHMVAVGYPLWLWTDDSGPQTAQVTVQGVTLTMTARPGPTAFLISNGAAVNCPTSTPYSPTVRPGAPSPTCGYTFPTVPPGGVATITAVTRWTVDWETMGTRGSLPVDRQASITVPVGELTAVVIN